ncbi:MAG: hypothetical protein ACKOHH_00840 [Bacteroidota bacterium]
MGGSYLRWRLGVADESSCELFMALLGEVGFEAFETMPMNSDRIVLRPLLWKPMGWSKS